MPRQSVYDMSFDRVYAALVAKAEKKGRTRAEIDECIRWLTGYVSMDILSGLSYMLVKKADLGIDKEQR